MLTATPVLGIKQGWKAQGSLLPSSTSPTPEPRLSEQDRDALSSLKALGKSSKMVLAFQNRGDYQWLATLKLFLAAFPDKHFVLANAMHAANAVNHTHYRDLVSLWRPGDGAPDFIIEGPFSLDKGGCQFKAAGGVPWVQVVCEPSWVYRPTNAWCPDHHSNSGGALMGMLQPPAVRMDTTLTALHEDPVSYSNPGGGRRGEFGVEGSTAFLWAPYGVHHRDLYLNRFFDRGRQTFLSEVADSLSVSGMGFAARGDEVGATPQTYNRPHLAAYVYSDCKPHRAAMFEALQRAAAAKEKAMRQMGDGRGPRRGMGVHALGPCSHNHDWRPGESVPARNRYFEHLTDYRFVIVMENTAELGYVTEKLGSALAAGAIPLYWGDPGAASKLFNPLAYIDAKGVLAAEQSDAVRTGVFTASDWDKVAQFVLEVDADENRFNDYMLDNVLPPTDGGIPSSSMKKGEEVAIKEKRMWMDQPTDATRRLGDVVSYPEVYPSPILSPREENNPITRPHVAAAVASLRAAHAKRQAMLLGGVGKGQAEDGRTMDSAQYNEDTKPVDMDLKQAKKVAAFLRKQEKEGWVRQ